MRAAVEFAVTAACVVALAAMGAFLFSAWWLR